MSSSANISQRALAFSRWQHPILKNDVFVMRKFYAVVYRLLIRNYRNFNTRQHIALENVRY